MNTSVLSPRRATATVVCGIAATALLGCSTEQTAEPEGASVGTDAAESVATTPDTPVATSSPDTQVATTPPATQPADTEVPSDADDDGVSAFTLADAAAADDPRVDDIECLYLTGQQDDELARVLEFRADRDRFFDIESAVVLDSRTEGLTFTEIAAEHGYTADEVQAGAAAMHGYCFEQMIGTELTEATAERRFQTTMLRFAERADAEPVGNGDGRPADGGIGG